jgi:hypothetical protein
MGSPKRFVRIAVGGRELEMHDCTVDEVCRMVAFLWPSGLRLSGVQEEQQNRKDTDG